jgi:hypothetical protein
MFLYTFKAFARYDLCQNELRLGFGDDKYTVKFDVGYDGKLTLIEMKIKTNVI